MAVSRRSATDRRDPDSAAAPRARTAPRTTEAAAAVAARVHGGREAPRPTDADAYQQVPRAVAAMPKTFADGSSTGWHAHPRGQLLYATRGVMSVDTPERRWTVPPRRALWIPAGVGHRVTMRGRVEMRTLYLKPPRGARLPRRCEALEVTPLAHALIERAVELPVMYDPKGPDGLAMRLLLAELERLPTLPLSLPWPSDPALAALCARLAAAPDAPDPVPALAATLGVGARTLSRRFVAQTGLAPGRWRQRMRALEAVARLSAGESVTRVALELGYDSPSAFGAMFRRTLAVPPGALAGRARRVTAA
jgi:AraC-like DNA-binding protein/quercetin dioxygenase-like cupin family protein